MVPGARNTAGYLYYLWHYHYNYFYLLFYIFVSDTNLVFCTPYRLQQLHTSGGRLERGVHHS